MGFVNPVKNDCYNTFYSRLRCDDAAVEGDYPGNLASVLGEYAPVDESAIPDAMSRLALHKQWLLLALYGNEGRIPFLSLAGAYRIKRSPGYVSILLHQRVTSALCDLMYLVGHPDDTDSTALTVARCLRLPYPQNLWLYAFGTLDRVSGADEASVDAFVSMHPDDLYYLTCREVFRTCDASMSLDARRFAREFKDYVEDPERGIGSDPFDDDDCWTDEDVADGFLDEGRDASAGVDPAAESDAVCCLCMDTESGCPAQSARFDVESVLPLILDDSACIILRYLENGLSDLARIFAVDALPDVVRIMRSRGCTSFECTGEEIGTAKDDVVTLLGVLKENYTPEQLGMLAEML